MFNLTGKTALVTGATGGIGEAIAKALHGAGAHVGISGRNEDKLKALAAELKDRVSILPADLAKPDAVDDLVSRAEAAMGQIDILVNNAGLTRDNLSMRMKDEEWQEVIDVNMTATFKLAKAVQRGMMKRRWGRIVNIASVVGVMGNPGQCNYVASKAGMIGWSKAMAQEIASRNITVNCVAPGFIATPMTDVLTDDQKERINSSIPAGRMGGPEDIAAATLYLASEEAAYVTGQTVHVNGGMAMI
ncbi:MAG: 3-oxoacyl-[acyl-carrier-protein] reductase [Alphaproteobacteria bacterium]|nr:3-oxoacyl-[acyl-carrier-protein] reductase [Alphaproteobacteria bacterium]MCD8519875.1 3-oxoacyl-[acyl-carrier-protein] reductase [Alphaproteobacteria bacterium]MCD8526327.1 3-oxoacyl-[acyl-carrier-protein] reductase [Alphaproteobacteria bacterium]MCD8571011.1 3-oxoacyl-[acyl-carrier-protein] reductase [Alphaproteobacteria bacterium]